MKRQVADISGAFKQFVDGYEKSPYLSTEWPMENGLYKQYSAFEHSEPIVSGTTSSIKPL